MFVSTRNAVAPLHSATAVQDAVATSKPTYASGASTGGARSSGRAAPGAGPFHNPSGAATKAGRTGRLFRLASILGPTPASNSIAGALGSPLGETGRRAPPTDGCASSIERLAAAGLVFVHEPAVAGNHAILDCGGKRGATPLSDDREANEERSTTAHDHAGSRFACPCEPRTLKT
jgi:hypothetical protein